jgi:hypothetical protein
VSVWFVRAALAYLLVGFTIGAALLWNAGVPFAGQVGRLRPAHAEFLLIGWTAQLTLGVALWIFPRLRLGSLPHGRVGFAWLGFGLLNAGVWLVTAGRVADVATLAWSGRLLEVAAVAACAVNLWGRVRPGLSQM